MPECKSIHCPSKLTDILKKDLNGYNLKCRALNNSWTYIVNRCIIVGTNKVIHFFLVQKETVFVLWRQPMMTGGCLSDQLKICIEAINFCVTLKKTSKWIGIDLNSFECKGYSSKFLLKPKTQEKYASNYGQV